MASAKLPAIELGQFRGGPRDGKPFKVELELLMEQNLLLQANSGGGKSWALRRLIEQAYGKLPIIVIDPEGEFSTLRASYDFLLVGKGGETPADPRSAKLLAHRLLELRVSAVCNLFELTPSARATWVATFIEAIVEAPKTLWGDTMIAIDEAHDFAPEKGHGRTHDSTGATAALVALASKGRKRGQLTVAATQRLGKLNKDFAAELKNVLIGQTWIDIDRERAAEALGIGKAGKAAFFDQIKAIPPGHFYALGRALALEPTRVHTGPVQTEHPTRGRRQAAPPPPTAKILHLLPQLGDLPKEAEQKLATEAELRAEIKRLGAELAAKPRPAPAPPPPPAIPARVLRQLSAFETRAGAISEDIRQLEENAASLASALAGFRRELQEEHNAAPPPRPTHGLRPATRLASDADPLKWEVEQLEPTTGFSGKNISRALGLSTVLTPSAIHLLQTLKASHRPLTRRQLATLAGMKSSGGAYRSLVAVLLKDGYMVNAGGALEVTEAGSVAAGDVRPELTGRELLDHWAEKLGEPEGSILRYVVENAQGPDTSFPRVEIASAIGKAAAGGSFRSAVAKIVTNGLFEKRGQGSVSPSPMFFE